jgi:ketosteroid isomerase-like protein
MNNEGGRKHMTYTDTERQSLETVRALERVRIDAIRRNDADAMNGIIDEKFVYINGNGKIYDRDSYVNAVRTHQLSYASDIDLTETDHRVDGDLVILVGMMLGHAHLDGEQQVYRLRNMRVWRARGAEWKLLTWQSSMLWNSPF